MVSFVGGGRLSAAGRPHRVTEAEAPLKWVVEQSVVVRVCVHNHLRNDRHNSAEIVIYCHPCGCVEELKSELWQAGSVRKCVVHLPGLRDN